MQEVQTLMRRLPCSVTARTCCRFGSQRRLVWRMELLTLCPLLGFLPQISQTFDTQHLSLPQEPPMGRFRMRGIILPRALWGCKAFFTLFASS